MPHAHILVKLDKAPTPAEIDDFIWATLPPEDDPELLELVLKHHIHGPCGPANLASPCMDPSTKTCTRGPFPKPKTPVTFFDARGFPNYRRPCKRTVKLKRGKKEHIIDDTWVVPYNRHILRKYGAHCNVELATHTGTIKYLFKVALFNLFNKSGCNQCIVSSMC